jgi:carbamoyltransferase
MVMRVLGLSIGHDASACVIEDGNIVYYRMSERLSRIKHDYDIFPCLQDLTNYFKSFDSIVVSYFLNQAKDEFFKHEKFIKENFLCNTIKLIDNQHHLHHAYGAMLSSGFEQAAIVVLDGSGSIDYSVNFGNESREIESIYRIDLKNKSYDLVYKHYHSNTENRIISNNVEISKDISVGWQFENCALDIGFDIWSAGKVMGLAQYCNKEHLLESQWVDKVAAAHACQRSTEIRAKELLLKARSLTNCKNIIVTGGYALNCVANFKYTELIENNLYIDPICFDAGISIGAAFQEYLINTADYVATSMKHVFLGNQIPYNIDEFNTVDADDDVVIELIKNKNTVAVFQGSSEAGQRALGNRSILFDPRLSDGQEWMNCIKGRESFRPFGCSVLLECAAEWFDMGSIQESPYMSYAIPINPQYKNKMPAVVHVDNTSRIQTVSSNDNLHLHSLIENFYKKTGVPILGNTSLNLAGEPLVETVEDAVNVLKNSQIKYLYLPADKKLIISQKY